MPDFFIGLMSGTSLDGVDGVLVDFAGGAPAVRAHASSAFAPDLRAELLALNRSGPDELHRAQLAANALTRLYAQVVQEVLLQGRARAGDVRAIGAHGQTVRHRPQAFDGTGYTVQLCQPSLLAELTGIDVVADFRSRDVAAGGQGAPLAPFFHQAVFGRPGQTVGVLNVGGISNLTLLHADAGMIGFDCGPGNSLMDAWCLRHTGEAFDDGGAWAAGAQPDGQLLARLLAEPYFATDPPKSTGRDLFNEEWLASRLAGFTHVPPRQVQATLAELTARACSSDLLKHGAGVRRLLVCGGGALNKYLMARLQALLPGVRVESTSEAGVPPLQVEAAAFAWLARKAVLREKLELTSTTGARGARVLGGIWPG
ncbi:MAG: Anhydro-N-acetylmuramic acid kinase [uncultured Ramlibacter sp.]|uniref:Anhydro-N-acetylmuramic acid kinase n=1 Tax=uncultured Ramlibacter sp. TaxID=260755 RepID=A0A6J4PH27_9BURK|nr:MAG: Anhydro-N-acetylmuramic acid kinase [uncultured Ramlibacter sp.]